MKETIWSVQDTDLVARISRDELRRLEFQSKARSLPPGCDFPWPASAGDSLYLVTSGRLIVSTSQAVPPLSIAGQSPKTSGPTLRTELTQGDFFGVCAGTTPDFGAVELAERSTIVSLPRESFQTLLNAQMRLTQRLSVWSGWRFRRYSQRVADNFFVPASKRLGKFLFDCVSADGSQRERQLGGLTDLRLARLLNSSREQIAACLEILEQANAVRVRRSGLDLLDLGALADVTRLDLREPLRTGGTVRIYR